MAASHRVPSGVGGATGRATARFWVAFVALVAAFAIVSSTGVADRWLHAPLIAGLARATALALAPLGAAHAWGTVVEFKEFRVEIVEDCDGTLPLFLYMAAVLAFPSPWTGKAWGVLLGAPVILLINFVRIISLVLLGSWRPDLFEGVHIYVWQALVVAVSLALFLVWVERVVRRNA